MREIMEIVARMVLTFAVACGSAVMSAYAIATGRSWFDVWCLLGLSVSSMLWVHLEEQGLVDELQRWRARRNLRR